MDKKLNTQGRVGLSFVVIMLVSALFNDFLIICAIVSLAARMAIPYLIWLEK